MTLHRFILGALCAFCMTAVCGIATVNAAKGAGGQSTEHSVSAQAGSVRGGLDQLYRAMEAKARSAAETSLTTVELIERVDFNVESETDSRLVGSATYYVHLRGNIIGRNRYLVIVRVRGELTGSGGSYSTSVLGCTTLSKNKK